MDKGLLKSILVKNKKKYGQLVKNIDTAIPYLLDRRDFIRFISS